MTMSLIASGTRSWRRCNWGDDVPRVLTARFMHETNTFSRVKTDMALIRRRDFHLENEIPQAFRGSRSALGATFEAAAKYCWTLRFHRLRCSYVSLPVLPPACRGLGSWLSLGRLYPASGGISGNGETNSGSHGIAEVVGSGDGEVPHTRLGRRIG